MIKKSKKKFLYGTWTNLNIINHGPSTRLDLELTLSDPQENLVINCRFMGVSGLELGDLELYRGLALEVKDITGEWLDGLKFDIVEIEHEVLLFKCVAVDITEDDLNEGATE